MDTDIWGPKLWNVFYEFTRLSQRGATKSQKDKIITFFHSLVYVLPCALCRNSYRGFIRNDPIEPHIDNGQLVEWIYFLKEKVNNKLHRSSVITYQKFQKRLNAWTSLASNEDVWDVLFMVAFNHPQAQTGEVKEVEQKLIYYCLFYSCIPDILIAIPHLKKTGQAIKDDPVKFHEHIQSFESLWTHLTKLRNTACGTNYTAEDMKKQYEFAKAHRLWTQENSQMSIDERHNSILKTEKSCS